MKKTVLVRFGGRSSEHDVSVISGATVAKAIPKDRYDVILVGITKTGEWRSRTPEWVEEKCKQCVLCAPFCPDASIPVKDGKRGQFDYDHCKGCGICIKACPFEAIRWKGGEA